jgi:hypothetical protein
MKFERSFSGSEVALMSGSRPSNSVNVFELDDDDRLRVVQERPPETLRARVEQAVRRCPKQALAILEE